MPFLASLRALLLVAAVGLALRLAVPVARGLPEHHAGGYDYYLEMAEHELAGEGLYRTLPYGQGKRFAIRTPLYPLALAALRRSPVPLGIGVVVLGALCGTATVLLAGLSARRLFGTRAGLAAAGAAALWPHAVVHDTALQDTALYTALFALAMHFHLRLAGPEPGPRSGLSSALAAAAAGASAVLTRVALLPSLLVLTAWPVVASPPAERRRRALTAAVGLVVLAVGLAPWAARNARLLGAPVLTSDAGRSLWLGNNPQTFSVYPRQSIDRAEERAWLALPEETRAHVRSLADDELASDAWFRRRALDWIAAHPAAALRGALRKLWATFGPWLSPEGSLLKQLVHGLAWTPAAVLAIAAAWRQRRRWRELAPVPLALMMLALQSAVFFGHGAYRLYLDPWVLVLASGLLAPRAGRG